jgi:hypothetical protein
MVHGTFLNTLGETQRLFRTLGDEILEHCGFFGKKDVNDTSLNGDQQPTTPNPPRGRLGGTQAATRKTQEALEARTQACKFTPDPPRIGREGIRSHPQKIHTRKLEKRTRVSYDIPWKGIPGD